MGSFTSRQSFEQVVRIVLRRRTLFLVSTAVFATVVLIGAHIVPMRYTGQAIFEFGLETAAEAISKTSRESFSTIKERLRYDVSGYLSVEKALTDLGFTKGLPHDAKGELTDEGHMLMQKLVKKTMEDVDVKWESRSEQEDMVSVSFTDSNPTLAQQLPNTLVANYIDATYERIREGLKRQHEFLNGKCREISTVMEELTRKKVQFEIRYTGVLPADPGSLQDQIQRTRTNLDELARRQSVAQQTLARLKGLQPSSPGSQPVQVVRHPNPELDKAHEELHRLEDDLESAMTVSQMTDKHPAVVGLKAKIERLTRRIQEMPETVVKEETFTGTSTPSDIAIAMAGAQSELEMTTAEISRQRQLLAGYEKLWGSFAPVREEYLRFLKEWDDRTAEAKQWQKRLEDVEVALGAAVNNRLTHLNAVQAAQKQYMPSFPNIWVVLAVAVLGGLAFGAGVVSLANSQDHSFSSPVGAQDALGLPVYGSISEILTPAQYKVRKIRRWTIGPAIAAVLVLGLTLSTVSIVMRLHYCRAYEQWKAGPVAFLYRSLGA